MERLCLKWGTSRLKKRKENPKPCHKALSLYRDTTLFLLSFKAHSGDFPFVTTSFELGLNCSILGATETLSSNHERKFSVFEENLAEEAIDNR